MWDFDGNRYLDFSSQLMNANLGHQHPKLVAAIQEAAGRLYTNPLNVMPHASQIADQVAASFMETSWASR